MCGGARQSPEKEAMQKRKERHTEIGGHALLENGVRSWRGAELWIWSWSCSTAACWAVGMAYIGLAYVTLVGLL